MMPAYKVALGICLMLVGLFICWFLQSVNFQLYMFEYQKVATSPQSRDKSAYHQLMASALLSEQASATWWSLNETMVDTRSVAYCRPLNHIAQGDEGGVHHSYTLLNAHVIIRHGERTTMYDLPSIQTPKISCDFEQYTREDFVASQYIDWVKGVQMGTDSKYPTGDTCKTARLTPRGVMQQIYNGKYLGKAYGSLLFDKSNTSKRQIGSGSGRKLLDTIYARTTDYSRTFQSALAFVYGFTSELPNGKTPVALSRGSGATNLCSVKFAKESCVCKALSSGNIAKQLPSDEENKLQSNRLEEVHKMKGLLGDVLGIPAGQVPWLGLSLEVFMGYVCQGTMLPCIQRTGECVTKELIQKLWETNDRGSPYVFIGERERLKYKLEIHPLLQEIAYRFLNITRNVASPKFVLYSGHDKTLTPLTIALGIHDGKWPPYGSRLVIELYSKDYDFYIRVLYNGKDLTSSLHFCDKLQDGLCSLGHFLKFVFSGFNINLQKNVTYEELCRL